MSCIFARQVDECLNVSTTVKRLKVPFEEIHKTICCICRHQASESNTEDGEEKANKQAKIKNAANLLQQRKMLQRNLRNLQQHTLSREILSGKIIFF